MEAHVEAYVEAFAVEEFEVNRKYEPWLVYDLRAGTVSHVNITIQTSNKRQSGSVLMGGVHADECYGTPLIKQRHG